MSKREKIQLVILNIWVPFCCYLYFHWAQPISAHELEIVLPLSILICDVSFIAGRRYRRLRRAVPQLDSDVPCSRGDDVRGQAPKSKKHWGHLLGWLVFLGFAALGCAGLYRERRAREATVHLMRGLALSNDNQYAAAITEYRQAIKLNSKLSNAYNGLGVALDYEQRHRDAVAEYREALRLDPKNILALINVGQNLEQTGDLNGAFAKYQEAIGIKSNSTFAHYYAGRVLLKKREFRAAVRQLEAAVRLTPQFLNARDALAWALLRAGEDQEALKECQETLDMTPYNPVVQGSCARLRKEVAERRYRP